MSYRYMLPNERNRAGEQPPRFSAQRGAASRECLLRSTVSVGGGRSPRSLCRQRMCE